MLEIRFLTCLSTKEQFPLAELLASLPKTFLHNHYQPRGTFYERRFETIKLQQLRGSCDKTLKELLSFQG